MARYRIGADVEFETITPGELRGHLNDWDDDRQRKMDLALRGVKPRRLPPMQAQVAAGAVVIGGDSGQQPVGPTAGNWWFLRSIVVSGLTSGTAGSDTPGTGTITAGAGSATLAAGSGTTGFTLSFSAAPSTTGTATLTGVAGGPLVYDIPAGQTSPYTVTFPNPLPASGTPTLTVAGLGTGAGAIVLYGVVGAGTADLLNMQIFGSGSGINWWQFGPGGQSGPPFYTKWGMGEMWVEGGEYLAFANPAGTTIAAAAGSLITVRGTIIQIPAEKVGELFGRR